MVDRAAALVLFSLISGCAVDPSGVPSDVAECFVSTDCPGDGVCVDGQCLERADLGLLDLGGGDDDLGVGPDLGADLGRVADLGADLGADHGTFPAHCETGILDGNETDVDCGGSCAACTACRACSLGIDCASGECIDGLCRSAGQLVESAAGTVRAHVRADGAILLARYAANTFHASFDPSVAQVMDPSGGTSAPAGFFPDPCTRSGHLAYTSFDPAGRSLEMQCGRAFNDLVHTASSSTIFTDFSEGVKGTLENPGDPGWGSLSSRGSDEGRGSLGACGKRDDPMTGGIGYCDGQSRTAYDSHVVSYSVFGDPPEQWVGCQGWNTDGMEARDGCSGIACPLEVLVWLHVP